MAVLTYSIERTLTGALGELSRTLIGPKSEDASDNNSSSVYGGLG